MRGVARSSAAGAGCHVLVVEDDAMIALMLGEILAEAGYRVSIAGSAETAVELFCLDRPDVATVNVNLPGASGLDLVRHLRRGGSLTPVILVTGSQLSSRDLAELGTASGGRPPIVLAKPFGLDAVVVAVEEALGRGGSSGERRSGPPSAYLPLPIG